MQVSPYDCLGCGVCLTACPAKGALEMVPFETQREQQPNFDNYAMNEKLLKKDIISDKSVKTAQFAKPYFQFSAACAGCAETTYIKLLSQLFGGGPAAGGSGPSGEPPKGEKSAANGKGERPPKRKFLENYCISLTKKAQAGQLDRLIGRDRELERVIQILNRRQKNNPCLIGEPGVGKTAIAEGLAMKIAKGDVPYKLLDKEVYLLDLTALVAGTQFRGQFESRMKGLIEEIKKLGNIILVIDEVHNLSLIHI